MVNRFRKACSVHLKCAAVTPCKQFSHLLKGSAVNGADPSDLPEVWW